MDSETILAVDPQWCPDCGTELSFTGVQVAGIGQFFCEACRYRHDHYIGHVEGAEASA